MISSKDITFSHLNEAQRFQTDLRISTVEFQGSFGIIALAWLTFSREMIRDQRSLTQMWLQRREAVPLRPVLARYLGRLHKS